MANNILIFKLIYGLRHYCYIIDFNVNLIYDPTHPNTREIYKSFYL